jgi:hypothetical protein
MTPPIYRAKRKDNREWVEGWYWVTSNENYLLILNEDDRWSLEIDPSTLAIHFYDMVDGNGERIWVALNDKWIGSSKFKVLSTPSGEKEKNAAMHDGICKMRRGRINISIFHDKSLWAPGYTNLSSIEVTGIYEGHL